MSPRSPSRVSASTSESVSASASESASSSSSSSSCSGVLPDLDAAAQPDALACPSPWVVFSLGLPLTGIDCNTPLAANDPAWGPTGLIAFSLGRDILFLDQAGGPVTNLTASLTQDIGEAMNPTWSPAA